ncbi:MAG: SCO family protein, partial [Aureliella sp.]
VRSEDLKGQPYVVGFFFTLCPSICVNQNAKVQELQEKYRDQPLRLLSISCDPEVDTPKVLAEYAKRFDADPKQWLFLTGEMDYIARVAAEMYFLAASRRFHAEKFVLVDAHGNNVGFYNWSDPLQFKHLQSDIDKLLDGQELPTVMK